MLNYLNLGLNNPLNIIFSGDLKLICPEVLRMENKVLMMGDKVLRLSDILSCLAETFWARNIHLKSLD